MNKKDHYIKFKLGIAFLDASAIMCCSTLKIGKILFILGIYLFQLGKNILFGFGNDTRNRSRFYSEKNHCTDIAYRSEDDRRVP